MSDTITRIDATFNSAASDAASEVTIFVATDVYRREKLAQFAAYGWVVKETPIDLKPLTRHERGGLIGPIWPRLPLEEILALLRDPPGRDAAQDYMFEPVDLRSRKESP